MESIISNILNELSFHYFFRSIKTKSIMSNSDYTPTKREIFGSDKPFRLGLFASSGSGKSHLISEMLTCDDWGII